MITSAGQSKESTGATDDTTKTPPPSGVSGGGVPATVLEADLIALKQSLEGKLAEQKSQIEQLNTQLAAERAAKQAVEGQAQAKVQLEAKLSALETTHKQTIEQLQQLQAKHLEYRKGALVRSYGLGAEQLKALTETQLEALEAVLPAVKPSTPGTKGFDASGTGVGDAAPLSGREKILLALQQNKH